MGNSISNFWDQSYPPPPAFTERDVPDQDGRVFIVTGGASGVGLELVKILYQRHGTVYLVGRSLQKADEAILGIVEAFPASKGRLELLYVDLADLATVKKAAVEFTEKEQRLDVLWNNAGVMMPPQGNLTKQGHELQLGTNCLGPCLFTNLLLPVLRKTAATSPPDSVRIAWAGSLTMDMFSPTTGVDLDDLTYASGGSAEYKYAQSKAGNLFLGSEFARRLQKDGIVSVTFNPGNLKTRLTRHVPRLLKMLCDPFLHDPIFGGYTELYAGLSPDINLENSGAYVIPWGRLRDWSFARPDILPSLTPEPEGGLGKAERFYQWCEKETKPYL